MDSKNDGPRTSADSLRSDETPAPIRYTRLWIGLVTVIVALLRGARLLRGRGLPPGPADPGARCHVRRRCPLHRPGHQGRSERLAVDGRAGGRHRLGPRRLRRARTGRPTGFTARRPGCSTIGPRPSTASSFASLTDEDQAALKARLKEELRTQHLRPEDGRPGRLPAAGPGDRSPSASTTPPSSATIRRSTSCATPMPSRRTRSSNPRAACGNSTTSSSGHPGRARRTGQAARSPIPTTGPPRQLIDNRPSGTDRRLVGRSASWCCWRASVPWRGTSPSSTAHEDDEPRTARRRPAAGARADALDAGDAEIFLGRDGTDRRPGRPRGR